MSLQPKYALLVYLLFWGVCSSVIAQQPSSNTYHPSPNSPYLTPSTQHPASNTLQMTLASAIHQAQDSSIMAFYAKHSYESEHWAYKTYLSGTGVQVNLDIAPSYLKQSHSDEYSYALPSAYNLLSLAGEVSFSKQINKWGGTVYAKTSSIWSHLFGGMADNYGTHQYMGTTPIRVGYKQDLLGWNAFRWEHRLESHHYELARKQLEYQMRQIAEQTANYYFDYVSTLLYHEIYRQNFLTADTLLHIGQKKFQLTTVTKDELMSLELERTNALNQLKLADAELLNARLSLLSYLHIEDTGQELILDYDNMLDKLVIDDREAITLAQTNNPEQLELDEAIIAAERDLDEARHRSGLQMGMDVSVGIQNINRNIWKAYTNQRHYAAAEVTFSVPLYDSGLARHRIKQAAAALQQAHDATQEQRRELEEEVLTTINLIRAQQANMESSKLGVKLADEAFQLIGNRYANGLTDMNTYQLALSRKDQSNQIYINLLRNFWTNYYKLCRLTMHEWITPNTL